MVQITESTRTVRTLLALSYGSATNRGFEWGFEGSGPSPLPPPTLYCPQRQGVEVSTSLETSTSRITSTGRRP